MNSVIVQFQSNAVIVYNQTNQLLSSQFEKLINSNENYDDPVVYQNKVSVLGIDKYLEREFLICDK